MPIDENTVPVRSDDVERKPTTRADVDEWCASLNKSRGITEPQPCPSCEHLEQAGDTYIAKQSQVYNGRAVTLFSVNCYLCKMAGPGCLSEAEAIAQSNMLSMGSPDHGDSDPVRWLSKKIVALLDDAVRVTGCESGDVGFAADTLLTAIGVSWSLMRATCGQPDTVESDARRLGDDVLRMQVGKSWVVTTPARPGASNGIPVARANLGTPSQGDYSDDDE